MKGPKRCGMNQYFILNMFYVSKKNKVKKQ